MIRFLLQGRRPALHCRFRLLHLRPTHRPSLRICHLHRYSPGTFHSSRLCFDGFASVVRGSAGKLSAAAHRLGRRKLTTNPDAPGGGRPSVPMPARLDTKHPFRGCHVRCAVLPVYSRRPQPQMRASLRADGKYLFEGLSACGLTIVLALFGIPSCQHSPFHKPALAGFHTSFSHFDALRILTCGPVFRLMVGLSFYFNEARTFS